MTSGCDDRLVHENGLPRGTQVEIAIASTEWRPEMCTIRVRCYVKGGLL